jgi:hypothetical protein
MGIRDSQEIPTNVAPHSFERGLRKLLVLGRAPNVVSAVPRDEQTCGRAVARDHRRVNRHESAAPAERCVRPIEQPEGALVVKVMDHTERQNHIEVPQVIIQPRRVANTEFGPIAERMAGARNVFGADVDPDVADVSEVVNELTRPASEIEHTRSWLRPNILPDKHASPVRAANNS